MAFGVNQMQADELIDFVLNINLREYFDLQALGELVQVQEFSVPQHENPWDTLERAGGEVFAPDCADLARLHALVTHRRMLNVLEFGSGYSTQVIAHALKQNSERYLKNVQGIRRANPFKIISLESENKYANEVELQLEKNGLQKFVDVHLVEGEQTTFNGQICGRYKKIPPICPDLIYIDGPMPMSYRNSTSQYMNLNHSELTNITCDLLLIEPMLLPGVVVIVDGMTNNARFLSRNLKRNWLVHESLEDDLTIMVLDEKPVGVHHIRQLNFQNGLSD